MIIFFCKAGLTYVSFFTAKEMVVRLCNWESLHDMRPDCYHLLNAKGTLYAIFDH